ncbi:MULTISPECIES: RNA polymerase sigma factor [Butyricimonas]|nr:MULTISPECIES: RNA polymerase sigma-70 factor [Butyricimonas]MCG4518733.1 RNA polymerase sigma-70 factor [Butyricimonas sp. DFI.6.44]
MYKLREGVQMNTDDNLLIKQIARGDEGAFKALYEEFFHVLLAVACKYVEREVAEDIVQDVFFKLWSTPQKFLHTTDLRFYLYRSVQNGCLNYIRNKKVEEGYRNKAEMVTEDFFYNVLLEEEIFIRLRKAVDELPEKYRVVINLNLDGLSDKEIAERLGITLDAVKQQKKRGKERLREHLDHPFLILFLIFL